MSTLTKEWLQQTIAELEEERDATPGVVNEDAANALAAMKIALASLEAEPVAYVMADDLKDSSIISTPAYRDLGEAMERTVGDVVALYTSPPAPVSVPLAIHDEDFEKALSVLNDTLDDCGDSERGLLLALDKVGIEVRSDARHAAMLQGAEPVTTVYKLPEETGSSLQLRNLIRQRHAEWSQATFGDVGPVGPLKHLSKEALEAVEEPDDLSEWADMQFLLWDAQRRAGISDGEITAAMEEKLKVNMARQWPEPKDGEPRLHIKAAPQQEVK